MKINKKGFKKNKLIDQVLKCEANLKILKNKAKELKPLYKRLKVCSTATKSINLDLDLAKAEIELLQSEGHMKPCDSSSINDSDSTVTVTSEDELRPPPYAPSFKDELRPPPSVSSEASEDDYQDALDDPPKL